MRLLVLGASGGVGREVIREAVARGHVVTAQTRTPGKIHGTEQVFEVVGSPTDVAFLKSACAGQDAVIVTIGVDHLGATSLFSDTTAALITAMTAVGVRRIVAVTGVGTGETRGHGGWLYNRIIYPFFTRHRYLDKERQELLLEASALDWTIVRPAPFADRVEGPLEVLTEIAPDVQLRAVTRAEVAHFLVEEVEQRRYAGRKPFIGHQD